MNNKNVITLLSGGLDSSTLAYWLKKNSYKQSCLFIDYGHKTKKAEITAAQKICNKLDLNLGVVNIGDIGRYGKGILVENNNQLNYLPPIQSFFPQRNMLLLVNAAIVAEKKDANHVAIGLISSYGNYPDSTRDFLEAASKVLKISNPLISILAPFIELNKSEILKMAAELGVPVDVTFSCDLAENHHCMICPSCIERFQLFK
ncbi:MAG: 7-cyano-7-deazaguanine synthase [Thermoanaerobacterium sp.]|nr:7-cyano-7-deazaguanine synthase [Thermoanaerobacterium sp.]